MKKMFLIDYTNKKDENIFGLVIAKNSVEAMNKIEKKFGKSDSFENIENIGETNHFVGIRNIKDKLFHITYTNSDCKKVSAIVSMDKWMDDDYDNVIKKVQKKFGKAGYDFKCTLLFDKSNLIM